MQELCVTMLCAKELCVTMLCDKEREEEEKEEGAGCRSKTRTPRNDAGKNPSHQLQKTPCILEAAQRSQFRSRSRCTKLRGEVQHGFRTRSNCHWILYDT